MYCTQSALYVIMIIEWWLTQNNALAAAYHDGVVHHFIVKN
jgi:hypothetical protein